MILGDRYSRKRILEVGFNVEKQRRREAELNRIINVASDQIEISAPLLLCLSALKMYTSNKDLL